jgi:hypothetical protein
LKGAHNLLSNSKDITLLIEVHGYDNYKPLMEFLKSCNFVIAFEQNYEWGDKHIIAKNRLYQDDTLTDKLVFS